jgi:hypothetical protein
MPTESLRLWLVCTALTGTSCSGSQQVPHASLHTDIGEVPADLREDYESFSVNCSKCHDPERALTAPVTDVRHWDMYVEKMMRTAGSAIAPHEKPHILRFLYWYTEQKNGAGRTDATKSSQMNSSLPTAAPAKVLPPTKEETQAPTPAQGVTSETEGESTP